jgi:putative ATP-dependent endonuclease of the OLD family
MQLTKLTIEGFRGIKRAELYLDQHSVLLGANNVGKSSIVDALGLLLGKEKLVRQLNDYDFFNGDPQPQTRINIRGVVTGFADNDPQKVTEWFNDISGSVVNWYNPKSKQLEFGNPSQDSILALEVAFSARFDSEELEYPILRYFVEGSDDPFENENSINRLSATHIKQLGFFLLPPHRTWEKTISFGSELFRKVIRFQNAMPGVTVLRIRDNLRGTTERIENQEPLSAIVKRINNELESFLGKDGNGLNFLPTAGDVDSILNCLTPYLIGKGDTNLPLGKHGSGVISLQTLLLLLEFGNFRNEKNENFILAAEEPEVHLQPSLHRRLVGRIQGLSTQSIVTTHSPEVASFYLPKDIIILRNYDGELKAFNLLDDTRQMPDANALMRLFTIYRKEICEALMNRMVIVPEGETEFRWFKQLINACFTAEGWNSYKGNITYTQTFGILPTQDSHVSKTFDCFNPLIELLIPFVDGDSAGNDYIAHLKRNNAPPKYIIQLPAENCLEDLIADILHPEGDDFTTLSEILGNEIKDSTRLREALKKQHKKHWSVHDALVEYISTNKSAFQRAHMFINSLSNIESSDTNKKQLLTMDSAKSDEKTTVYTFNFN